MSESTINKQIKSSTNHIRDDGWQLVNENENKENKKWNFDDVKVDLLTMEKEIEDLRSVFSFLIKDSLKPVKKLSEMNVSSNSRKALKEKNTLKDTKRSTKDVARKSCSKHRSTKKSIKEVAKMSTEESIKSISSLPSKESKQLTDSVQTTLKASSLASSQAISVSSIASTIELSKASSMKSLDSIASSSSRIVYELSYMKSLRYSKYSIKKPNFIGKVASDFKSMVNATELKYVHDSYPQCFESIKRVWRSSYELSERSSIKRAQELLNDSKLNSDELAKQFAKLKVRNEYELNQLVDLLYDRAIEDAENCEFYVKLCQSRNMREIAIITNGLRRTVRLDMLMMKRCQLVFDANIEHNYIENRHRNEIDKCTDLDKKKYLVEYLNMEMNLFKINSLGNITLLGSLYRHNSIYGIFIDSCIDKLIANDDQSSYEILCILFKLIGDKYQKSTKNKEKFDQQISVLETLLNYPIDSSFRALIVDVLSMHENGWKLKDQLTYSAANPTIKKDGSLKKPVKSTLQSNGGFKNVPCNQYVTTC